MEFSTERSANRPPILSRTDDGLGISFKASFQYTLRPEGLYDLYMKFGEDYKTPCENFAVDILNDQATKHDASKFFFEQDVIAGLMQDTLKTVFANECNANLESFQLSGIDLPNQFESAIDDTEVARQLIVTTKAQKENVKIELGTQVQQAEINKDVIINQAKAKAEADVQRQTATAQSLKDVALQEASAYAGLKTGMGLTNTELLSYIEAQTVAKYDQDHLIIGAPGLQ